MTSRISLFSTPVGAANARSDVDDSHHLGYDIERWFNLVVFTLFGLLFAAQNLTRIRRKGLCVRLTVPALFQICGLLVSLVAIVAIYDHHGVFQVFHSLASFYIAVNIDSLMFAALSAYVYIALKALQCLRCKSHVRANYAISVGVCVAHWVLANAGVTYLWYTGDSYGGLFANGVAIVCNVFACYRLLSSYLKLSMTLGSNLQNTDQRCRIRTYQLLNRWKFFTFAAVFFFGYAIAVGIFFVVRTLRHGHKIVDPAHFGDFEKTMIPLIYVLFLAMLLWFSWQSFDGRESADFNDHKHPRKHTKRTTARKRDTNVVEMKIAQSSDAGEAFRVAAGGGSARAWPHGSSTSRTPYNTNTARSSDVSGATASSVSMSVSIDQSLSFQPSAPLSFTPTDDDMRFMLLDEPHKFTTSVTRKSATMTYSNDTMAPNTMSSLSFGNQHQR